MNTAFFHFRMNFPTHLNNNEQENVLTSDLVRKVADRVYAMLLADLRVDRERARLATRKSQQIGGGH